MSGISTRKALTHWGKEAPDWVLILAEECDRTSQQKVGLKIGYSGSVVNQALKKNYAGDLKAVEQSVRGAYLNATVECPILGELALHRCLQHQRAKYSPVNQMRVRLYKACRGLGGPRCKHAKLGGGS